MDKVSQEQESVIIDFLKRWGIDSPELIGELLDHYVELALDEMKKGWEFEQVVQSWKTKETFRSLKKIQSQYEAVLKKRWKNDLLMAGKWVFGSWPILSLVPTYILLFYFCQSTEVLPVLTMVIGIKALLSFGLVLYLIRWNKRRNRLDGFKRLAGLAIGNAILGYQFFDDAGALGAADQITTVKAAILATFFIGTFVIDLICFHLFMKQELYQKQMTDEILEEYKVPYLK